MAQDHLFLKHGLMTALDEDLLSQIDRTMGTYYSDEPWNNGNGKKVRDLLHLFAAYKKQRTRIEGTKR